MKTEKGVNFLGYVYELASGRWKAVRTCSLVKSCIDYDIHDTEEKTFETKREADNWIKFPEKAEGANIGYWDV